MSVKKTSLRVGINGFGRIGRGFLRASADRKDIEVVAINDLSLPETRLHLLRFDSLRGRLQCDAELSDSNTLVFNGKPIRLLTEEEPSRIPWDEAGVDVVLEATGQFINRGHEHLSQG